MCKEDFICILEVLLISADIGVNHLVLINEGIVQIEYKSGNTRKVNIEADSHIAIAKDVLKKVI